ncbi:OTU domain-containing protein [Ananas comosus]|uniref:Ubiquitin thioesterase OTU n=1 Tax=Ananas comosus TaxID=4615 RepID=A0A199VUY7_ANACO|nr:OTU domain-containing protein [Ananas comosus]
MLRHMPAVSIPHISSRSTYSHFSQAQQGYVHFATKCKSYRSSSTGFQEADCSLNVSICNNRQALHPLKMSTVVSLVGHQLRIRSSTRHRSMSLRLSIPTRERLLRVSWSLRRIPWRVVGISTGLCLSFSASGTVYAESSMGKDDDNTQSITIPITSSHGKKVYTDYSIIGIPGDGRCLFRSVAYGARIRSGRPLPDEDLQRELADELRARVADEFVKRRAETEWFVEGDFDTYVSQIRKPHVWGGEPELFMASHVLRMPIKVYMLDEDAGGLITIAEYGQEYGKDDPIRVLYHGFGHYDALLIPGRRVSKARL